MKKTFCASLLGGWLGLTCLILWSEAPVARGAEPSNECLSCRQYTIPVSLSPTDPTLYHIAAWLYSKGPVEGKTIQVVLHGGTYDHNYFNFPYQPFHYSYLEHITDAGYAVLDLDRLGAGLSDHPTPENVTLVSGAYTIHQIIQGLRSGALTGVRFKKIMLVGHSLGSGISMIEAGSYRDVDAVILSGFASALNQTTLITVESAVLEANADPRFAALPNGYLIVPPSVRAAAFYNLKDADPNVVALDQILQQTATDGELEQLGPVFATNTYSSLVTVPVLIANGSDDALYTGAGIPFVGSDPASIKSFESGFFPAVTSLSVFVLQNSGHDINLHLNAPQWFQAAIEWADRYVGSR